MKRQIAIILLIATTALLSTVLLSSCVDPYYIYSTNDRETIGIFEEQLKYTTKEGETFYSYRFGETVFTLPATQEQPKLTMGHVYKIIWHYSSEKLGAEKLVTSFTELKETKENK